MNLYIWEGNGISDAYHDDGTLVVLAESPEDARRVVKAALRKYARDVMAAAPKVEAIRLEMNAFARANGGYSRELWHTAEGKALAARQAEASAKSPGTDDGTVEAMSREPDRVIPLDHATIVAFNGGGYD